MKPTWPFYQSIYPNMASRPATWVPWCWSNGCGGYEVEFMTLDGETVVVTSLEAVEVRPIAHPEVAHVRSIQATSR